MQYKRWYLVPEGLTHQVPILYTTYENAFLDPVCGLLGRGRKEGKSPNEEREHGS